MYEHFSKEKINSLIDLTGLSISDNELTISELLKKAKNSLGEVAYVCIYSNFIQLAKQYCDNSNIKIATVLNFPHGSQSLDEILKNLENCIKLGANEIDIVIPYFEYIQNGKSSNTYKTLKRVVDTCLRENVLVKAILESGELKQHSLIKQATEDCINAGVNFIKTSTGKTDIGATLEDAEVIIKVIKQCKGQTIGFKASGGVKDYNTAISYMEIAQDIMGESYINSKTFRLGASSLLDNLLNS